MPFLFGMYGCETEVRALVFLGFWASKMLRLYDSYREYQLVIMGGYCELDLIGFNTRFIKVWAILWAVFYCRYGRDI